MEEITERARGRRDDDLLAVWAVAREDVSKGSESEDQRLWLAQASRRVLSRPALQALLGYDRVGALGLIGCEEVIEAARQQQVEGMCDNHLHSGAADELDDMLDRLVPRVVDNGQPRRLKEAVGPDARASVLNAGPVVLALSAACALLNCPDAQPGKAAQRLAADEWWDKIVSSAHSGSAIEESMFEALRARVRALSDEQNSPPKLSVLYDHLRRGVQGESLSATKLAATRRGLVALSVLYSLVSMPHEARLKEFVQHFSLMGVLQRLFGEDRARLASALRTMYIHENVRTVELRKSVAPESSRTISVAGVLSEIATHVEQHAASARDVCEKLEIDDLIVRMPLTFTRKEGKVVDLRCEGEDHVAFRAPVAETLALADAIVQATQHENIARFIGAVDVVGDEKHVPNWLYALSYQRIARSENCQLEFACHAGEYFADRMEGLRRIAELAFYAPATVRRVGHCLALGIKECGSENLNNEPAALLENLAWSLLVLSGGDSAKLGVVPSARASTQLVREMKRTMLRLADLIFGGKGVGSNDVREWYLGRFDLDTMAKWIPRLKSTPPTKSRSWPQSVRRKSFPRPRTLVDAMLVTSIYDMYSDVRLADGNHRIKYDPSVAVPSSLLEEARTVLDEACALCLEPVRRWLSSSETVIESCPSSNTALSSLSVREHPVWEFHGNDLLCSINTDDPALFGASISEEYVHAGMAANAHGGDGGDFVASLAQTSRSTGTIQRPLCPNGERPLAVYRALGSARRQFVLS